MTKDEAATADRLALLVEKLPHEPRCRSLIVDSPLHCNCAKKELSEGLIVLSGY